MNKMIDISFAKGTPEYSIERFVKKIPAPYSVNITDHAKILICTPHLFILPTYHPYFQDFVKKIETTVTILDNVEEVMGADYNMFDYVIGQYDLSMKCDRYLCGWDFFNDYHRVWEYQHKRPPAEEVYEEKKYFCNFIYSNPNGHPMRKTLFEVISSYKKVHSLGTWMHNHDGDGLTCRSPEGASEDKWYFSGIELRRPYLFTIAAENARFRGYTSEKITNAFLSDSLPIYWGDSDVGNRYNPAAMINANNLSTGELVETIRHIDNNKNSWIEYMKSPCILPDQYQSVMETKYESECKLIKILTRPEQQKGSGTFPSCHINSLIDRGITYRIKNNLKQKIRNHILTFKNH